MSSSIIYDMILMFIQYVPYAILTGFIFMMIFCAYKAKVNGLPLFTYMNRSGKRLYLIYIFYIYCFMILGITFLSREPGSRNSIDLMFFSTISHDWRMNIYPIENILLFIPMGMMLPKLNHRFTRPLPCLGLGFFISLSIEISQLITERGYCQIDDILTNGLGCVIGYVCYWLYQYLHKKIRLISRKM